MTALQVLRTTINIEYNAAIVRDAININIYCNSLEERLRWGPIPGLKVALNRSQRAQIASNRLNRFEFDVWDKCRHLVLLEVKITINMSIYCQ